ncbi:MAG TPA: Plug domain-containing protein [Sphingobium sp.]|uniref:Plug domain-containing protein n=1 Tax=Sphingobium sp. TaxID=1912891 RepID=UPI002ED50B03
MNNNDIVVTARRKDELVQEVPATINVVSADQMEKLNFRTFTDVQQLVPGLSLEGGGSYLTTATVRGVQFNPVASGTNPTVEFYLNDTPIASNFLFNSTFDLGQFELLRGPQGTLRGRASATKSRWPARSIARWSIRPFVSGNEIVRSSPSGERGSVALKRGGEAPHAADAAISRPPARQRRTMRLSMMHSETIGGCHKRE